MKPSLSLSNLERLEEIKKEIKSLLVSQCDQDLTLHQLSIIYKEEIGDDIPFKNFNYSSLKEFLQSMPDTVTLSFDEKNKLCVHHVESGKTRHLTSLIVRQKSNKRSGKSVYKPKLHLNSAEPLLLWRAILKLSSCSTMKGRIKKHHLLSEIQDAMDAHSSYTIEDLNAQLYALNHLLVHNETYIHLKSEKKSDQAKDCCCLGDFIKQSTRDRLQRLAEKYEQGIVYEQLPEIYRQEYGIDLEYNDLGFNDIFEFVAVLPKIFKFIKKTPKPVENVTINAQECCNALPTQFSSEVSKRQIPKDFMNLDDTVGQINVEIILGQSNTSLDVIVSEICNPSLFWIIVHKKKRKLLTLMDNLQEFYVQLDLDKYRIPPIALKPGLHVACIYSNRWHRGIIKEIKSNFLVQILFYDYGTTKVYKANKLYFLHKKFSTLPAQAIPCSLYNIKPMNSDEWSTTIVEKFVDRAIEKDFVARVFGLSQENNSLQVDLIDTSNVVDVQITRWMVSNDMAIWGHYTFQHENFINKHHNECLEKKESNLVKIDFQDENRIILDNDRLVQNSDYCKPAKQLEAVQKYKKKFKLSEKQDQAISDSSKKQDEIICLNDEDHLKNDNMIHQEDITKNNIEKALKELQKLIIKL